MHPWLIEVKTSVSRIVRTMPVVAKKDTKDCHEIQSNVRRIELSHPRRLVTATGYGVDTAVNSASMTSRGPYMIKYGPHICRLLS